VTHPISLLFADASGRATTLRGRVTVLPASKILLVEGDIASGLTRDDVAEVLASAIADRRVKGAFETAVELGYSVTPVSLRVQVGAP
jgi:hypothetical protein